MPEHHRHEDPSPSLQSKNCCSSNSHDPLLACRSWLNFRCLWALSMDGSRDNKRLRVFSISEVSALLLKQSEKRP